MRIATNVAVRSRQQEAKHRHASIEDLGSYEKVTLVSSMNGKMEKNILDRSMIESLLAELPVLQRNAVWLRVVVEYTDEEVSQIMNVPVGTIKSWVWRSMSKLRANADTTEFVMESSL